MPQETIELVDIETLELTKDSYVDAALRNSFSDLVFNIRLRSRHDAAIYFLLEHNSYPDGLVPFQVLRYSIRINEQRLRSNLPLALVIPVVLYHGSDKWSVARSMDELFEGIPESFLQYVPRFSLQLLDLSQYSDDELRGDAILKATLLLLKHIWSDSLADRLPGILSLLRELWSRMDWSALRPF